MRLDQLLARATGMSRTQVQRHIKNGDVLVDGEPAHGSLHIEGRQVHFRGELVHEPQPVYLMLHKPVGYVCANSDGQHPIVLDLLGDQRFHPTAPLQIVGRLDLDASGLVLLTTDGQWNHRITAPGGHCSKTYRVRLASPLTPEAQSRIEGGLLLQSESKPTLPCQIYPVAATEVDPNTEVDIVLREGKYHQVKRLFAAVGNRVLALHRSRIGNLELDLAPGEFRHLTPAEVQDLGS
jgi:16S rRNA pseudouridine516 synthase